MSPLDGKRVSHHRADANARLSSPCLAAICNPSGMPLPARAIGRLSAGNPASEHSVRRARIPGLGEIRRGGARRRRRDDILDADGDRSVASRVGIACKGKRVLAIQMHPRPYVRVGGGDTVEQCMNIVLAGKLSASHRRRRLDQRPPGQRPSHGSMRSSAWRRLWRSPRVCGGRNSSCSSLRKRRPSVVGLIRR